MPAFLPLIAFMTDIVKPNYNEEITGANLQSVFHALIDALGESRCLGFATTSTSPPTQQGYSYYFATAVGVYTNLSGVEITENGVYIIMWDPDTSAWNLTLISKQPFLRDAVNKFIYFADAADKLGLRTATPTAVLDVNGDARIRTLPSSDSDRYLVTDDLGNVGKAVREFFKIKYRQTASNTIQNTATELTVFGTGLGTLTINAAEMKVGTTIRTSLYGYISTLITPAQAISIRIMFDETELMFLAPTIPENLNKYLFSLDLIATIRTTGETGTIMLAGSMMIEIRGAGYPRIVRLYTETPVTIDTTKNSVFNIFFRWNTANVSNMLRTDVATLEIC